MPTRKTHRASSTVREDEALKLRSLRSLSDAAVVSKGGDEIGVVHEFLFDPEFWAVRYIAVRIGDWLTGNKVLVSPAAIKEIDWELPKITLSLKKSLVRNSPALGIDELASRRFQIDLYRDYGWLPYWLEKEYHDVPPRPSVVESKMGPAEEQAPDPRLFSTRGTTEYRIDTLNGEIGHVEDFIIDEEDWMIYYLIAAIDEEVPEEESGKEVLISTEWVQRIMREEERIYIDLDKEMVLNSPEYDPSVPVDREYELELYDHYGRPRYWDQGGDTEEEEDTRFSS